MSVPTEIWENAAAADGKRNTPLVSVAVPFYKVDVCSLAEALIQQSQTLAASVELLFADDASHDMEHTNRLKALLARASLPCRLFSLERNVGRATIRNILHGRSRGGYTLFLDSDMYPDTGSFLARYVELAAAQAGDVIVGGCSYKQVGAVPRTQKLYFYHSNRTQCVDVERRRREPLRYVFTNNLMLKRGILEEIGFDQGYTGWGYEDTDWGFRAAEHNARVVHIDNTATHLGLIDDNRLIEKYKESVANFLRLARKFPLQSEAMPMFRMALRLSRLPLPFRTLSYFSELLARSSVLPVRARYLFLQGLRLWLYSNALAAGEVAIQAP